MKQQAETVEVREGERCIGIVRYSLTECTCSIAPVQTYGIAVSFQATGGDAESAQVDDISCSQMQVEDLLHLLVKHTVTPVALRDVVEDYLASF